MCHILMALHTLMYSKPSLALAAEDMMALMILATLSTAPLFVGNLNGMAACIPFIEIAAIVVHCQDHSAPPVCEHHMLLQCTEL